MTPHDLANFKLALLQQRTSLQAQLNQLRGGAAGRVEASAAHFGGHEDSQAQAATARDLEFALDAHESEELDTIAAALQRLADGTYGACVDCSVSIPLARLQATPQALRCIPCQEKFEAA
jgi:DnaK suppressor protein